MIDQELLARMNLDPRIPPFPYWGGKAPVAGLVWERFGDVNLFLDPFCGGNSIMFGRPHWDWEILGWRDARPRVEIANDISCFLVNALRGLAGAPELVAQYTTWPATEADLHARHIYLLKREYSLTRKILGDPDYFDPKLAGYWLWGMAVSLGGLFCQRMGPWTSRFGLLERGKRGRNIVLTRPHLSSRMGVRKGSLPVDRERLELLESWFCALSKRLDNTIITCHNWKSIMTACRNPKMKIKGVFLDPPYSQAKTNRDNMIYLSDKDAPELSEEVREWALEYGDKPDLRIALCGYEGEHEMPDDWEKIAWSTQGGFANWGKDRKDNRFRERIWFSPHCLKPEREEQVRLF